LSCTFRNRVTTPSLPQKLHAVRIDKVIAGGQGLARTEAGQVILSGFVLPGETVLLRELSRKAGYIEAELAELLESSTERVAPHCPQYGQCGGCDFQHGRYAEQLRLKRAIVAEAMQRAHVPLPAAGVAEVLPSPQCWGYRHRLRLKISPTGRLGFFKKKSNEFIAVNSCPAAADEINAAVAELADSGCLCGLTEEAELHCSPLDRHITLVLPFKEKQQFSEAAIQIAASCAVIAQIGCVSKNGFQLLYARSGVAQALTQQISVPGHDCVLSWSGGCFSQVNPGQNEQLVRLVLELAGTLRGKKVLDLYCGMGNFSVPLALAGGEVVGVEGSPESVRWARHNAKLSGIKADFLAADVHASLRQMIAQRQRADLMLLDPPRAGIGKTAALLPELGAEKIICISCDPVTLARDLAFLCGKNLRLTQLIPLDMFPQTSHIETVAVLERS